MEIKSDVENKILNVMAAGMHLDSIWDFIHISKLAKLT